MKKDLRVVAVSDTHSSTQQFQWILDNDIQGDIFIHAGDFTHYGREQHFLNFIKYLKIMPFKHKVVIAGNHDIALDDLMKPSKKQGLQQKYACELTKQFILKEIRSCADYLDNDLIELEGLKIFGSPYTAKHGKGGFQYPKSEDQSAWRYLPEKVDILITHGPPFGILDQLSNQIHVGSKGLLDAVKKLKPILHIFGHIHSGHGKKQQNGIIFMNVAKKVEIIDLPLNF